MTVNTTNSTVEVLKSKAKFEEFITNSDKSQFEEILKDYPENQDKIYISDLTQKFETFVDSMNKIEGIKPYVIWAVTSPKPEILKTLSFFNENGSKNTGIFVFKASSNEDQIKFECVLKPQKTGRKNYNTGEETEKFNLDYWGIYKDICIKYDMDMLVKPQAKRWQMIGIGRSGVQVMQTISRKSQYVATELYIQDKNIFDILFANKTKIEKEIEGLEWLRLDNKKASRIVKKFEIDLENPENLERAAMEHIRMAQTLKQQCLKYIPPKVKKQEKPINETKKSEKDNNINE